MPKKENSATDLLFDGWVCFTQNTFGGFSTGPCRDKSPHQRTQSALRAVKMMVSMADFKASLSDTAPAPEFKAPLAALWWAAKGEWDEAHKIVQDEDDADSAWVHAYLHRVEGDLGNAGYWYRRAGKPVASGSLETEWQQMVSALLVSGKA
jgi:hypothetical protein